MCKLVSLFSETIGPIKNSSRIWGLQNHQKITTSRYSNISDRRWTVKRFCGTRILRLVTRSWQADLQTTSEHSGFRLDRSELYQIRYLNRFPVLQRIGIRNFEIWVRSRKETETSPVLMGVSEPSHHQLFVRALVSTPTGSVVPNDVSWNRLAWWEWISLMKLGNPGTRRTGAWHPTESQWEVAGGLQFCYNLE